MKKLIGRLKRHNRSSLTGPALVEPTPAASTSLNTKTIVGNGVDASVHDNSRGHTYIISGSNNTFNHGSSFTQKISKRSNEHIQKLNRSYNAEYDMVINATRGPCTPETRTIVLQTLENWRRVGKEKVFWLNGMAGTGKTTIAFSASQNWDDANQLGASFFCSRGVPDCRDIMLILTTIATQLSIRYPVFAEALEEALSNDQGIERRRLDVQLRKLIIDPWVSKRNELPEDVVIVVDALDECQNGHAEFIRVLLDNATKLPLRILITSRPELQIRDMMMNIPQTRSTFILHEVEKNLVQTDIIKYLDSVLSHRASPVIIKDIAELAGPLFIYAATLARLFLTGTVDIQKCIQVLKSSSANLDTSQLVASLDELYREILQNVLDDGPLKKGTQEMKEVLCSVVCAREPLTRYALAGLWGISQAEITRRLDRLSSVLFVPEDQDRPIAIFHASFPDFLLDESRSDGFCFHPRNFNALMFKQCILLMNSELHRNLCHVDGRPSMETLGPEVIESHISPGLQYAAVYWIKHWLLSGSLERLSSLPAIKNFIPSHLLHWVECLGYLRRLHISVKTLENLLDQLDKDSDFNVIVYEYFRLIQQTYDAIEYSPMEIYSTALVWSPQLSPVRTRHSALFKDIPHVLCGAPPTWTGLERVIGVHSAQVNCIAISLDGDRLISASDDQGVHVWNLRDQTEEYFFTDHINWVGSVATCRDQNHVVSGSVDKTIWVCDLAKREGILCIKTASAVWVLAASSDGNWIAAEQKKNLVWVWDGTDGRLVHSLEGHEGGVFSLSFIPNSTFLVSGSEDATARIWDVMTGQSKSILCGHDAAVLSVACSPAGDMIVTGSGDNTARLWDTSGKELQVFHSHSGAAMRVAFMPDGKRDVVALNDNKLSIWDVTSGAPLHVFDTPRWLSSIAIFEGGAKIAASFGRNIGIWSLRGMESRRRAEEITRAPSQKVRASRMEFSWGGRMVLLLPSLEILDTVSLRERDTHLPRNGEYTRGALSACGRLTAASTKKNSVISVWELAEDGSVAKQLALTGHTANIKSLSFSHDELRLVSASKDNTARVWNVTTGHQVHSLSHPTIVYSAVFSHDGDRIASAAHSTTYIWNTHSGQQLQRLDITDSFVAFTPDDHYLTTSTGYRMNIWNTKTWERENSYQDYYNWTTTKHGSSYALNRDGWIYYFASFSAQPHKVLWVPTQYRPSWYVPPVTSSTSELGARFYLSRSDGFMTIAIPKYD